MFFLSLPLFSTGALCKCVSLTERQWSILPLWRNDLGVIPEHYSVFSLSSLRPYFKIGSGSLFRTHGGNKCLIMPAARSWLPWARQETGVPRKFTSRAYEGKTKTVLLSFLTERVYTSCDSVLPLCVCAAYFRRLGEKLNAMTGLVSQGYALMQSKSKACLVFSGWSSHGSIHFQLLNSHLAW